jgi:hypothetical protein
MTGEPDDAKVSRPVRWGAFGKVCSVTAQLAGRLPYYTEPRLEDLAQRMERVG